MERVRVLCVDDEPHVLEGLTLHLRRTYEVTSALSGAEGLAAIREKGPFAVIMSDMRMPVMDGAEFLRQARELAPDTTRMLLTGYADMQAAIAAVNNGQIFRFLTKPCPPEDIRSAFEAAARQYQLITSERVLLEQTLLGSIKALSDVLSVTNPLIFGKAVRIRQHVGELAERFSLDDRWVVEAAAMLSMTGYVAIPDEVAKKHYFADSLTAAEEQMVARVPVVTDSLLANIPRLEPVRQVLSLCTSQAARTDDTPSHIAVKAEILRIACDFEDLSSRGKPTREIILAMKGRQGRYVREILDEFAAIKSARGVTQEVREIPLSALSPGMVLAEDVRSADGRLLIARGLTVSLSMVERLMNFDRGFVKEPLRVTSGNQA